MTLLAFLRKNCLAAPSVKALKRCIEAKKCSVNGIPETFSTHRLKAGDDVQLELAQETTSILPTLLWEDASLLIYDKPAGMVCHPNAFPRKWLIHRLDKETTGVLLVAKSKSILEMMVELFRQKKIDKTYLAIVDGVVHKQKGDIRSKLAPCHRYQGQTLYGSSSRGQLAQTEWSKVASGPKATLLKCHPITGRTHQLRVHLKEMGYPIVGDYQYSKQFRCGYQAPRHLLHAYTVSFPHPVSEELLTVTAPLPQDFMMALKVLGIKHPFSV